MRSPSRDHHHLIGVCVTAACFLGAGVFAVRAARAQPAPPRVLPIQPDGVTVTPRLPGPIGPIGAGCLARIEVVQRDTTWYSVRCVGTTLGWADEPGRRT